MRSSPMFGGCLNSEARGHGIVAPGVLSHACQRDVPVPVYALQYGQLVAQEMVTRYRIS